MTQTPQHAALSAEKRSGLEIGLATMSAFHFTVTVGFLSQNWAGLQGKTSAKFLMCVFPLIVACLILAHSYRVEKEPGKPEETKRKLQKRWKLALALAVFFNVVAYGWFLLII